MAVAGLNLIDFAKLPSDPRLTDFAVGTGQGEFVANRILPTVPESALLFRYPIWDNSALYQVRAAEIGPTTDPWPTIGDTMTEGTAVMKAWGMAARVPREMFNDQNLPVMARETEFCGNAVQLKHEYDVLTAVATDQSGNGGYTSDYTSKKWSANVAGEALIVGYVKAEKLKVQLRIGVRPDVMVMGRDMQDFLATSNEFVDRFKYTDAGGNAFGPQVAEADELTALARWLGLKEIIVPEAIAATSHEGQVITNAFMWPDKTAQLYYRGSIRTDAFGRPSIAYGSPAWGTQFVYSGVPNAAVGSASWVIPRPEIGFGVDEIHVAMIYTPAFTMPSAAELLTNLY